MNTILESTNILGIRVTTSPKEEILEYVKKYLGEKEKGKRKKEKGTKRAIVIVTPNPEQIVLAQKDKHFATILNSADVALPDGIGLVAAMWLRNFKFQISNFKLKITRTPGVEFMEELVGMAAKNGLPVAFIGGRGGVAEAALARLKKKYQGLSGWSWELPELSIGDLGNVSTLGDVGEKIKKTNTKFVFVGLGAPKQEYLIEKLVRDWLFVRRRYSNSSLRINDERLTNNALIFMSVGGSFDILAGSVRRAPVLIRSIGLEWLWRLIREPWRWRRQLALVKFLWLVVNDKL